jgi:ABC-type transporter Mla maintaining outer membrane lipid asymmetry ATPase subunit MlaF
MLAIARALMRDPRIILLNEPFEGLARVCSAISGLDGVRSAGRASLGARWRHSVKLRLRGLRKCQGKSWSAS